MSINTVDFRYTDAACVTSLAQPGKFIVGMDCCKLVPGCTYNYLNGTLLQKSPNSVLLNLTEATAAASKIFFFIINYALLGIAHIIKNSTPILLTCQFPWNEKLEKK